MSPPILHTRRSVFLKRCEEWAGAACETATLFRMWPETWNREELYKDVWERPLTKLQSKYGVSNVAIGKACRKLKIPLPGRGYWAKLAAGHKVKQVPLAELKNVPVVYRVKTEATPKPTVDSTDPELVKIAEVESSTIPIKTDSHKLIASAAGLLRRAKTDEYGLIQPPSERPCVHVRVAKDLLDRALTLMSTIIFTLERNGFGVKVEEGSTSAHIFGQDVKFGIVEDLRVKERRKEPTYSDRIKTVNVYERSGNLAFEIWVYADKCRKRWADGKTQRVETMLPKCVAGLMLVARTVRIREEEHKRWQEEWREKKKNVRNIRGSASNWMSGWQAGRKRSRFENLSGPFRNTASITENPLPQTAPEGSGLNGRLNGRMRSIRWSQRRNQKKNRTECRCEWRSAGLAPVLWLDCGWKP